MRSRNFPKSIVISVLLWFGINPAIMAVDDITERLLNDLLTAVEGAVVNVGETGLVYIQFERQFGVREGSILELIRQDDSTRQDSQVSIQGKESIRAVEIFKLFNNKALAHVMGSADVQVGDQVHLARRDLERVIVAPFSYQQEITPLSLELQEKLTAGLVREGIPVIVASQLEHVLKDRELDFSSLHDFRLAKAVAESLGVQALILGNLDEEGNQIVVNARLIDFDTASILAITQLPLPRYRFTEHDLQMLTGESIAAVTNPVENQSSPSESGLPSEEDGRNALAKKIHDESNGLIRLISFRKTDALEREFQGVRLYQLEYTAEIEFLENLMWNGEGPFWEGDYNAIRGQPQGALDSFNPRFMGKAPAAKGQRKNVSSMLIFERTVRGWRLRN